MVVQNNCQLFFYENNGRISELNYIITSHFKNITLSQNNNLKEALFALQNCAYKNIFNQIHQVEAINRS